MMANADLDRAFEDWKRDANNVPLNAIAEKQGWRLRKVAGELVGPCPAPGCGGKDRFSISPRKGAWNCRKCGGGRTAPGLVIHMLGVSFTEACEILTGRPPPNGMHSEPMSDEQRQALQARRDKAAKEAEQRKLEEEETRELKADEAAAIFAHETVPMAGTLAEAYLIGRGIPVPPCGWSDDTRFCPALIYKLERGNPKYPALVSGLRDLTGGVVAIQGVFLNPKTAKKIDREESKLTYGAAHGAAVQLGAGGPIGNPCEGVETGYAIRWIIGHAEPVFCTLGTSGLKNFEPPLEIRALRGWSDGDKPIQKKNGVWVPRDVPAGRDAMNGLRVRMVPAGIEWLKTEEPPPGRDWLDIWNTIQAHKKRTEELA